MESSERFRRVVACFEKAADLPPADRAAFLDRSCAGDPSVRREVEAMLVANEREDAALAPGVGLEMLVRARPGTRRAEVDPSGESSHPELLGQYRILRVLGEGGMGIVYEAEQAMPRRTVALKAIRPGLASRAVLRRFEHEAHVLGRMHHPGIAQIYEAGTAMPERGLQAFIAMEFVDGRPLVEHAKAAGASDRQKIELLVQVCDAVQHAHQRGVIHRDLKPSNILVDRSGHPRVLDFGVARLSDSEGIDARTTGPGILVGTLAYMSPEQVAGDPAEVDARTDVYALGVLLHELLAGSLPHPVEGRSLPAIARSIQEDPAPSLASIDRRFRGDLSAIAAKALEPEKERRYASAADLGADLRRHLAGEPVAALRDARLYVLRRQLRKHRFLVAAGAAFVLGLAAFAIVAEVQRRRADESARALAEALSRSNVARARLLAATGDFAAAEDLLWDEHLASPTSRSHWSLWELYSRHPCLETFEGPVASILSIDATRDGRWIATGTHERQVALWETAARRGAVLPGEHDGIVLGLAFDPSGARLYSVDSEGLLFAWDTASRSRAWELRIEGGGGVLARDASGATLAVACPDGRVRLVDVGTRRVRSVLPGHAKKARCVVFDARGSVVSAGDDGVIRVWGADADTPLAEIEAHADPIVALDVDPTGSLVASGAADGTIRVFDLASRRRQAELALEDLPVRCLRFSPDGASLLATGSRRMRIFDARALAGSTASGRSLEESAQVAIFDPDGKSILAGGASAPLRRWEALTGGFQTIVELPTGKAGLSGFARDGRSVATTQHDGRVHVWRLPECASTATFQFGSGAFQVIAFDPRTERLLAIETAGPVHVCELAGKRELFARDLGANALNGARFSADGTKVACARKDGSIEVLDATTGATVAMLEAGLGETQRLSFAQDSTTVASTHTDGKIGLWTLDGARSIGQLSVPWPVFSIAFVPGRGPRLAVGGWNGTLQVWDLGTRSPVATMTGHAAIVTSISSAPDGSLIASASFDGTVRLWDAATGEARMTFEPGAGVAQNVSIAPDGSRITSAHDDGTFRIWDLRYCDRHIAGNLEHQRARHAALSSR